MYEPSTEIDTGTKAYIIAVYSDLYPCVINPAAVVYCSPSIRSKLKKYLCPFWDWMIALKNKIK